MSIERSQSQIVVLGAFYIYSPSLLPPDQATSLFMLEWKLG